MRFLTIMGGGPTVHSGTSLFGFTSTGSGRTAGIIGQVTLGDCPPSMVSCSNGTLLVATGYGPMKRMRQNEKTLTLAGVPAPQTAPVIVTAPAGTTPPSTIIQYFKFVAWGQPTVLANATQTDANYDFSSYGQVVGYRRITRVNFPFPGDFTYGALVKTQQGLVAEAARKSALDATSKMLLRFTTSPPFEDPISTNPECDKFLQTENQPLVNPQVGDNMPVVWKFTNFSVRSYAFLSLVSDGTTTVPSIDGTYQCWQRYVDKDGNYSNPSPVSTTYTINAQPTITYTQLEIPGDNRVVKRQIFRNVNGSSDTFYLDVETTDLTLTELNSSLTDDQLKLQLPQPMFDNDGFSLAYLYTEPPYDKPYITEFNGRIWAAGTVKYRKGQLETVNGNKTVHGVGTKFNKNMVGWQLFAAASAYTVYAVDEALQNLTLDRTYEGATDNYVTYTLQPFRGNENLLQFSLAGYPEAWPIENAFGLPQDDDEVTGIIRFFDSIYILKTRHIYMVAQGADPLRDSEIKPFAGRGCLSARLAVAVDHHDCYMLDRQGIHKFTPRFHVVYSQDEQQSIPVADLFREETDWKRINWRADPCLWHGIHMEELSLIRFYVAMDDNELPSHAICFDYRKNRWWVEDFPLAITTSALSNSILGRPLLGTEDGRILTSDIGPLDLIDPKSSTTRLAVIDSPSPYATRVTVNPGNGKGTTVAVTRGLGLFQIRMIADIVDNEITVDVPWLIEPDETSVLQIGAISYYSQTGEFNTLKLEMQSTQNIVMKYISTTNVLEGYLSCIKDGSDFRVNALATSWGALSGDTVNPTVKRMDFESDLGYVADIFDSQREADIPAKYSTMVVWQGFSGQEKPKVNELYVSGSAPEVPGQ